MNIPKSTVEKITNTAKLLEVISDFVDLKPQGRSYYGQCPVCGKKGKGQGLIVTPSKDIYKCFSCDQCQGNNPISFLMNVKNKTYIDALKYLAEKYNIVIIEDKVPEKPQKKKKPSTAKIKSFRDKQLEESGLTDEDQKASIYIDEETLKIKDIFESASLDQYKQIVYGDDMIIWYYDLNGKPVMYQKPKTNKFEHLFRVRWQNPLLHLDKEGRPIKYQSPVGSGSHIYIPEIVRKAYQSKLHHKRLYIQEGEKKAEKACKHGLFSIGIMGIHNIAYNKQLPFEIQLIIKTLAIEEVIFVIDSDWNKISENVKDGDWVDQRPYSFYRAIVNYRDYFRAFTNQSIYLEIYFAYILDNENHDKGIDDLLTKTLKNKEDELLKDIDIAINEKEGKGQFIQVHKISTVADTKLLELWSLDSSEKFAELHREKLINLKEFRINKLKWRFNKEGKLELAQPLMPDEIYWTLEEYDDKSGRTHKRYTFDYLNAYNFLHHRGYGRIMMVSQKYEFAFYENNVVALTEPYQIKDFVVQLTKEIAPRDVINMMYRGAKMYLGPDSLSNIDFINPEFERSNRFYQNIYFKNKFWHITADKITEANLSDMEHCIWSDNINPFEAKLIPAMAEIVKIDDAVLDKFDEQSRETFKNFKGQFFVDDQTSDAKNCHFFQFLKNTGEFYWDQVTFDQHRNIISDKRTTDQKLETNLHLVSKMSAIGYLLHRHQNLSERKAIIAMDGKLSEIGSSNGRSGKSLVGFAVGKVVPQVYIGGKNKYLTDDRFIFEEVTEKTCSLFIDDVRANVDFEFFFPLLGGRVTIEKKAIGKVTYQDDKTPKLYISTNHAITGEGGSHRDRQFIIAFSDYYNEKFKPVHQFGVNFFDEWDHEQWNLFYNCMALCLQVYLKFGLVEQPTERIEKRRLRQEIGEDFLQWADEFYSFSEDSATSHLDEKMPRHELYSAFLDKNQAFKKFYTPTAFKRKFKKWCQYNELQFNPHCFDKTGQPGADDKTGGVEYFMVSNTKVKGGKI